MSWEEFFFSSCQKERIFFGNVCSSSVNSPNFAISGEKFAKFLYPRIAKKRKEKKRSSGLRLHECVWNSFCMLIVCAYGNRKEGFLPLPHKSGYGILLKTLGGWSLWMGYILIFHHQGSGSLGFWKYYSSPLVS